MGFYNVFASFARTYIITIFVTAKLTYIYSMSYFFRGYEILNQHIIILNICDIGQQHLLATVLDTSVHFFYKMIMNITFRENKSSIHNLKKKKKNAYIQYSFYSRLHCKNNSMLTISLLVHVCSKIMLLRILVGLYMQYCSILFVTVSVSFKIFILCIKMYLVKMFIFIQKKYSVYLFNCYWVTDMRFDFDMKQQHFI